MGFAMPVDQWIRGALRDWAEDLLSPESLGRGGFLAVQPIRQKWKEHLSGTRNWQYLLWPVLMFQAWLAEAASAPTARLAASAVHLHQPSETL
jgi:asparagine synthase (glutamine-hydrolysing)